MEKRSYTDEEYWNHYWELEGRNDVVFYFDDIVTQYIDWMDIHSYMEIGGAPGSIMTYLYHRYGVSVSTIDFTDYYITDQFLKKHNVENYEIVQEDFGEIDTRRFGKKYDLVASWGFIEHFSREQCNMFIEKHKDLVDANGYLILELPNIRKFFLIMYFLFNRKLIKIHNLKIMDTEYLRDRVTQGNEFEILYVGYHIAINDQNEYFIRHQRQRDLCMRFIEWVKQRRLSNSVKGCFFPYIIVIAKRHSKEMRGILYESSSINIE